MADITIKDLKASIDKYITNVNAAVELYKSNVNKTVNDAVQAYKAGEQVDMQAIKDEVDKAGEQLVPPFEPSNVH